MVDGDLWLEIRSFTWFVRARKEILSLRPPPPPPPPPLLLLLLLLFPRCCWIREHCENLAQQRRVWSDVSMLMGKGW